MIDDQYADVRSEKRVGITVDLSQVGDLTRPDPLETSKSAGIIEAFTPANQGGAAQPGAPERELYDPYGREPERATAPTTPPAGTALRPMREPVSRSIEALGASRPWTAGADEMTTAASHGMVGQPPPPSTLGSEAGSPRQPASPPSPPPGTPASSPTGPAPRPPQASGPPQAAPPPPPQASRPPQAAPPPPPQASRPPQAPPPPPPPGYAPPPGVPMPPRPPMPPGFAARPGMPPPRAGMPGQPPIAPPGGPPQGRPAPPPQRQEPPPED